MITKCDDKPIYIPPSECEDCSVFEEELHAVENRVTVVEANKQDKLTAGDNITIDSNNVISATGGGGGGTPSTTVPLMDGTAAVGTETAYARGDHVHPTDTTLAPKESPELTGTPKAPTAAAGTNTTQIATTAFVKNAVDDSKVDPTTTTPKMDGTAAVGTETKYARGDHVHPTDTSRAPLASPTFTGTPTAPTAAAGTDTTQIATTAFVQNAIDAIEDVEPTTTTPKMDGTAAVGTETKYARGDHVHPTIINDTTASTSNAYSSKKIQDTLGTTDISSIDDGTVTGAIDYLNQNTTFGAWSTVSLTLHNCTGTLTPDSSVRIKQSTNNRFLQIFGRVRINSFVRTGANPGASFTWTYTPTEVSRWSAIGYRAESPSELVDINRNGNTARIITSETYSNAQNGTLTLVIPFTTINLQ